MCYIYGMEDMELKTGMHLFFAGQYDFLWIGYHLSGFE